MLLKPSDYLGQDGPIAKAINGYQVREQQQEMADAVLSAIEEDRILVAEAGTGTGKTFAYLVPAILSGRKVIVSTGTRNLQDQLFSKDLPLVRQAMEMPLTAALLKGRGNYLCIYRLGLAEREGRFASPKQVKQLHDIGSWGNRTESGDIGTMAGMSEDEMIWPMVTSTADNCLGQDCPDYAQCFLVKARKKAQEADIVVVNHHLLFADMALKDDGFGELLPSANAYIIDEAHQIPDVATNFLGTSLSSNQIVELARDVTAENLKEAGESDELPKAASALQKAIQDMRLSFGIDTHKAPWQKTEQFKDMPLQIEEVDKCFTELRDHLEPMAERGKGLENCYRRAMELHETFTLLTGDVGEDNIHWYETFKRSFTINTTPLNIADSLQQHMQAQKAAWIFTSATIAVGESFDYFNKRMGIEDAETHTWASPFDYKAQSLLYVPKDMPAPNTREYVEAVVKKARPVIDYAGGSTFMLFTSHRALQQAAEIFEDEGIEYPLLVQGTAPRSQLLSEFRRLGNAVLLGTGSFWEGVDVRGEALSCVIIDKLPFAPPDDPVTEARVNLMKREGGNPFMQYQVPEAVITLKQGAGRLIRDVTDYGVLMICDPRLIEKHYGKIFVNSLPDMLKSRDEDVVRRFYLHVREREAS